MATAYLALKTDLADQRVFCEHPNLQKISWNALLPMTEVCRAVRKRTLIVERQMPWRTGFERRTLFAARQAYLKHLHAGQDYVGLQPVYALVLMNQIFGRQKDPYCHHYQILNLQSPGRVLKGLEFVFLEIPKFKPMSRTYRLMQVKWLRLSELAIQCHKGI